MSITVRHCFWGRPASYSQNCMLIKHMHGTGYIFYRAQCILKMWGPCLKIIKNFHFRTGKWRNHIFNEIPLFSWIFSNDFLKNQSSSCYVFLRSRGMPTWRVLFVTNSCMICNSRTMEGGLGLDLIASFILEWGFIHARRELYKTKTGERSLPWKNPAARNVVLSR